MKLVSTLFTILVGNQGNIEILGHSASLYVHVDVSTTTLPAKSSFIREGHTIGYLPSYLVFSPHITEEKKKGDGNNSRSYLATLSYSPRLLQNKGVVRCILQERLPYR